MLAKLSTNRCALYASLGLGINLLWCTLAGHAIGFSGPTQDLGLIVNPRFFFLLGILAVGVALVIAPRLLREHDKPLTYVLPLASSIGTACFALAARQDLFDPTVFAITGLVVFGIGYFWIVARYNLLLARTQTFRCITWCIVAALAMETLALLFVEAVISPIWQIILAITLPLVSAFLFEKTRRGALASASREPSQAHIKQANVNRKSLLVLIVAAALLLATVRSFSSIGLWGFSSSASHTLLSDAVFWLVSAVLLALFAHVSLVKTAKWPFRTRFQPAFIVVIGGLFVVVLHQALGGASAEMVNEIMRLDDSCAHLLFWLVVITSIDALPFPSYRVMGIAAISYATSSILWVLLLSSGAILNSVIALVAVYALTVVAMHGEWLGSEKDTDAPEETTLIHASEQENKVQATSSPEKAKGLSGKHVSQIIAHRCKDLAVERKLSPRETEVFILLAQGRTRTLIQEELVLAENTVKTHIAHIYTKLGVGNRQDMMDLVLSEEDESSSPTMADSVFAARKENSPVYVDA